MIASDSLTIEIGNQYIIFLIVFTKLDAHDEGCKVPRLRNFPIFHLKMFLKKRNNFF